MQQTYWSLCNENVKVVTLPASGNFFFFLSNGVVGLGTWFLDSGLPAALEEFGADITIGPSWYTALYGLNSFNS